MKVEEFEKIKEMWKGYILVDGLEGYDLKIDDDVPESFAAIALYLDSLTVRAAGDTHEFYEGYRKAATDILNLIGVEILEDNGLKQILIKRKAIEEDKQEVLKKYIWE